MPAKSIQQFKYIMAMRNKYKNKSNAPKDFKWVFDSAWDKAPTSENIEEDKNENVYAYNPKIERYNRVYKEDYKFDLKPESELADFEFAIILPDGERLFRMDTKETAQTSINKLVKNLTSEQYKMALNKLQMKYPGLEAQNKKS